jgi:hypothetical protein
MKIKNRPAGRLGGGIPSDAREWVDERTLLQLSLDAVQTLDWSDPDLVTQLKQPYRPQMMLTLLTYGYSAGIYASQDLEAATRTDATARYICAHNYPDAAIIRRFRKQNRERLRHTLEHALLQVCLRRAQALKSDYSYFAWLEQMLEAEVKFGADERIELAMIMDRSGAED